MLTATVLVSLSEEGKISLDAPLGNTVKGLGARLSRVTPHQLMTHSAGIVEDFGGCYDQCDQEGSDRSAQPHGIRDDDYFFTEPGRIFSYAAPGFMVAGHLIQELSGKPYADAMDERLFKPLGMTHTTFRPTTAMTFPLSQGHDGSGKRAPTVVRPFLDIVAARPAGFAYTTVHDLARFAIAFMNGGRIDGKQVLSPSAIATLSKPYVDVPSPWPLSGGLYLGEKYGYGLFIQEHRGVHVIQHGGIIPGFGALLVMVPEHRFAVVVLANKTASILGRTAERAMELMLPLTPSPATPRKESIPMTPAEVAGYTGTYVNGPLKQELSVRNGTLVFSQTDATPGHRDFEATVTKTGENRFAYSRSGGTGVTNFILIPGQDGKIEYLHSMLNAARRVDRQR